MLFLNSYFRLCVFDKSQLSKLVNENDIKNNYIQSGQRSGGFAKVSIVQIFQNFSYSSNLANLLCI